MAVGPHVRALILENAQLIWEDIEYQEVKAGFVRMITTSNLFGENQPPNLKISQVAVVPQDNRRSHILNLSAEVADPKYADNQKAPRSKRSPNPEPRKATKSTRQNPPLQSSVNDTTEPAEDQSGIKALGPALPSIRKFMFNTNCTWEIN
jgi:hypothetical protein